MQPGTILSICDDPDLQLMCAKNYVADKMPSQAPSTGGAGTHSEQREKIWFGFRRMNGVSTALEVHDRSRFKVIGISVGRDDASDERQRIIAAVDEFHSVEAKSDREIARLIHECDIDILIDLIGHTEGGRLGILAQRPAPVQASYIGYPGTTGAAFIDYLITDEIVVPDENQRFYSENIVRLPSCYLAYDPGGKTLSATPTRAEVGLPERGFVFCSFNNSYKIRPTVFDIPRSRHDPKILWVDDAEIVGDRITKVRPIPRNLFTQKTERRIGELGASCVALVVSDVSVHEAP